MNKEVFERVRDYVEAGYGFSDSLSFFVCDEMISHLVAGELDEFLFGTHENVTDDVSLMVAEMESFFQKDVDFSQVVSDMSLNYHESIRKITGEKPKDVLELSRDMSGSIPNASWNIDSNPLVQMLETPYHPDPSNQSTKNR